MDKRVLNMAGERYNRLLVISFSHTKQGRAHWNVRCLCGGMHIVPRHHLRSGHTGSCGQCGLSGQRGPKPTLPKGVSLVKYRDLIKTRAYRTWSHMKNRCQKVKGPNYENYAKRGITVCDEWKIFANFYRDMGDPPKGMTLDRKDNNKGYNKANCRWATHREQANNVRSNVRLTYEEQTMTVAQWSRLTGIAYGVIITRHHKGWTPDKIFNTPVRNYKDRDATSNDSHILRDIMQRLLLRPCNVKT